MNGGYLRTCLAATLVLAGCSSSAQPGPPPETFQQVSDDALATLTSVFYQDGSWNLCEPKACGLIANDDFDWGADSLTAALYLRWSLQGDASIPPMMAQLDANGPSYGSCTAGNCPTWSDVPLWDSVAASRENLVTGAATSLKRAQEAFAYVDTATQFALGACPDVDYQEPAGADTKVKTLETDSNYVKAALLLYQLTQQATYLTKAQSKYASIRTYFLDPSVPLYTVYVLDDGQSCAQIPRRFYASVNGNMIWNGVTLAAATGQSSYLQDAVATAQALATNLADANGVFADLQTDDDTVVPLVEGMLALAQQGQSLASQWLETNARAMAASRAANGVYGRFFDGPAPAGQVSEWQAGGGFALAFAAGSLWPGDEATTDADAWSGAVQVSDDLPTLPSSIQFTGRAIAVYGNIGETSYQLGQAAVLVDGVPTFDQTGIHQDETNAFGQIPDAVLFAWRWPTSGTHTLTFQALPTDPKNGGPFLHVTSYAYVP